MGAGTTRAVLFAVLGGFAVAVGVAAGLMGRGVATPGPVGTSPVKAAGEWVDVHVAGWVVSPGVVSVREGAIVAEAIEAAGGLRVGARPDSLNLAAVVGQGEQILVPGPDRGASSGDAGGGLLSINQAAETELQQLPGVGPVLAARIVAYREDHGRFEEVEDLLEVPGIGESKLDAIRDLVRP